MNKLTRPRLSVITATYNAVAFLPKLITSLRRQSCKDFQWVVADGGSTDGTLELLKNITDIDLLIISEADFGIYDALNKAIKLSSAQHYIVIGSDDYFYEDTISSIIDLLDKAWDIDLIVGQVEVNNKLVVIRHHKTFFYGASALVSSHSVGCVFNKALHLKYGYYSNKYSLLADSFFIKKIFTDKDLKYQYTPQVYGVFSNMGQSGTQRLRVLTEFLHIQLTTEKHQYLQLVIFFIRFLRVLLSGSK